jgi:hypothetical protein
MPYFHGFFEYLKLKREGQLTHYDDDARRKEIKNYISSFKASKGNPFQFFESFFNAHGLKLYIEYYLHIPTLYPRSITEYDAETISWRILKPSQNIPSQNINNVLPISSMERDILSLFREQLGNSFRKIKKISDSIFDKQKLQKLLEPHLFNIKKNILLPSLDSVTTNERMQTILKGYHKYFLDKTGEYFAKLFNKWGLRISTTGEIISNKTFKRRRSFIDQEVPLEKLIDIYKLKFKQGYFISRETPFDDVKSIFSSRDLNIEKERKLTITLGCETKIAVETLMRLAEKKVIPHANDWAMIEKYAIFQSKNKIVLKQKTISHTASIIESGVTSRAHDEIIKAFP